ncbi:6,7-dimethyl-8-ribityllumazine synthase, partial [bacterium F11]
NIEVIHLPGAFELPYGAQELARTKKFGAVICLGCILEGETTHDKLIAQWVSMGIGIASLQTRTPILFGVLTPRSEKQAYQRTRPGPLNRGKEMAQAALQMIQFHHK